MTDLMSIHGAGILQQVLHANLNYNHVHIDQRKLKFKEHSSHK